MDIQNMPPIDSSKISVPIPNDINDQYESILNQEYIKCIDITDKRFADAMN